MIIIAVVLVVALGAIFAVTSIVKNNSSKVDKPEEKAFEIKFYEDESGRKSILSTDEAGKHDWGIYSYNIYSYNGDVKIVINNQEISLRDALIGNKIKMQEILEKANKDFENEKDVEYLDGGSKEYKYPNYTLLKLNKIGYEKETLQDVYFMPAGMTYSDLDKAIDLYK